MLLADALLPVFTFGSVLLVIPALVLGGIVALILKKRKIAKWLFISVPLAFLLGVAGDALLLSFFYKPHRKPIPPAPPDTLVQPSRPDSLPSGHL